ncbi:MAG: ABC transporter ATP-binding protein [Geodermatophilaceae bacterium]
MTATAAVEVTDLVKRYPKRPDNAVDGITFTVARGEIFGLLGPNGAGKSTTIGVLTTRVRPTSGTARVVGIDVAADPVAARARLAVVPQRTNLDRALTARQNLIFHAAYHGVPVAERGRRADTVLDQFGLGDRAKDKVDFYSGGMGQRLLIARAMMHAPEVLFLDEPSTGLDPQARLFVWDRVRELREQGVTIVLTTHDMDEAAALADRVGIIDHGTLLALDTPDALTHSLPGSATLDLTVEYADPDSPEDLIAALGAVDGVEQVERVGSEPAGGAGAGFGRARGPGGSPPQTASDGSMGSELRVRLYLTGEAASLIAPVTALLAGRGARLTALGLGEPSLEDVFISLTGRDLR